jgi:hypothetical protein
LKIVFAEFVFLIKLFKKLVEIARDISVGKLSDLIGLASIEA